MILESAAAHGFRSLDHTHTHTLSLSLSAIVLVAVTLTAQDALRSGPGHHGWAIAHPLLVGADTLEVDGTTLSCSMYWSAIAHLCWSRGCQEAVQNDTSHRKRAHECVRLEFSQAVCRTSQVDAEHLPQDMAAACQCTHKEQGPRVDGKARARLQCSHACGQPCMHHGVSV